MSVESTADTPLVLYTQLTLGPAHLARIRALDALEGIRCRGVQLASAERTRRSKLDDIGDHPLYSTLTQGEYESLSRRRILSAALRHLDETGARGIIIDAPADPVQQLLGRAAMSRNVVACTRWAATWADHPRHRWKEWLKGFMYRGWDAYFATGVRSIEYLNSFGVPGDRIFTCGNPVDSDAIERARASMPDEEREQSFLFVGRFLRLKNLERFARAYVRYRTGGGNWSLHLVGFGESEAHVRDTFRNQPGVTFHGHLDHDDLIPLYLHAGCLVLPSYSENWGLVLNEAMHAGMPIAVSTIIGSLPELLSENQNGISFNPFDEAAITAALHEIGELSSSGRESMGVRSRQIISAHTPDAWARSVRDGLKHIGFS